MRYFTPLPKETVQDHIEIFLKSPNSIYVGHIASAAVLLYIASFNPAVPVWFLWGWGILELAGYPLAMEVWRRLCEKDENRQHDPYRWIWYMDILSLLVGASWGMMLFISLNPDNAAHFAIQMSIAAGATAAAVRSLAVFPRTFLLYGIAYLGLLATRLFTLGDDFVLLGGLVIIFLLMLLRFSRDTMESVSQYIAIRGENLELAERYQSAAAEASHANREKTRLLAAASHDLRQPIHAIGLFMETLPIDTMEEKSKLTLQRMRNSLQTLSRLFNALLDVSLLDSGKIQVRESRFNLREMLDNVLDDYEPLAEIAHVTLILDCPEVGVDGDPVLIRRMVQNLLSNAIRHTHDGSVRILVKQMSDKTLSITVSDDGPGIAKQHQAAIFQEFTQISSQAKSGNVNSDHSDKTEHLLRENQGIGLGLAIVRRLADLQKLTIAMKTSPSGTDLTIENLQSAPLPEKQAEDMTPSRRISAIFEQKQILVVDDDQETLAATAELLRQWGCQILTASSMEEVQELKGSIDLIISDFSFGTRYTGLDIINAVRKNAGEEIKALIISGDSSENLQQQIRDEGLLLIHKPVQPAQLRSALLGAFMSNTQDHALQ